jgi:hypothetical protein
MTPSQIKNMILDLFNEIDYDIAKQYVFETAEEPEYVEANLQRLLDIVDKHLNPKPKKKAGKKHHGR